MKRSFPASKALAVVLALVITTVAQTATLPLPSSETTNSINRVDLKKHLCFLASDELGGRYTFSDGNRIAARYLAAQLESYGFRGAAKGNSFFQKIPLAYRTVDVNKSGVTLDSTGSKRQFKYGDDVIAEKPLEANVKGELVFVGYGVSAPQHNHDDYAALDVKGKIVVVASGLPESLKSHVIEEEEKVNAAIARGATAMIFIPSSEQLVIWNYLKSNSLGEQLGLPPRPQAQEKNFAKLLAGSNFVKALAQLVGRDSSALTFPAGKPLAPAKLAGAVEVKMSVTTKAAPVAQNVVAILEGTDAKLKDEYVVLSAHYDHLETEGNEVYNGADDDGSGTSAVLEIAQAFALERPKRSVLVVFHTAEELGLYGSEYNTDYEPVVPLRKLVANLNIDMIGRSREPNNNDARDRELTDHNSLYVIGADKLSTELHRLNEQTNKETARLRFDYLYNADNHPQQFYSRSDHYNYARHGVPVIFYFTGVHRDYHQPTDDIGKINFEKMERITRLIYAVGYRVANLHQRPVVDKKFVPDGATR